MSSSPEVQSTRQSGITNHSEAKPRLTKLKRRVPETKSAWRPVTNLGRLVKAGRIKSIDELFLHSCQIKEVEIIDHFYGKSKLSPFSSGAADDKIILKDEVMGISPVQKQSSSGQRTRFRAVVIVGDHAGHLGMGIKCDKEVATAIRGAIIKAKLGLFPVRRGYWGSKIGFPHTVPLKVTGKCASVVARLIPAPRGTGIVGSPICKKIMSFAGVNDCFSSTSGHSRTKCNFIAATILALRKTYSVSTPDLWFITSISASPLDFYSKSLEEETKA